MADMSNYLEIKLLDLTLKGTAYAGFDRPYVSLHTADPTDAGTGTEVSGGSYARTRVTMAAASGAGGSVASTADVTFPTATAAFGTVGWIGLWDSLSGGNMLYHTALDAAKTIDTGDVFKIVTGNLTVTLA